jgi:hypothetical protein
LWFILAPGGDVQFQNQSGEVYIGLKSSRSHTLHTVKHNALHILFVTNQITIIVI